MDEIRELTYEWERAEYYGEGRIGIPFLFETSVYADSPLFKGDYYAMPDEDAARFSISDLNEHFYSAEGEYEIRVEGLVVLEIGLDLSANDVNPEVVPDLIAGATVRIDELEHIEVID